MISLVALLALILDQIFKHFALGLVGFGLGFCNFSTPVRNDAAAFSVQFPNAVLAGFTAFVLVFIVIWLGKNPQNNRADKLALGLVLGGGLGNLLDRLVYGGVTDFISCVFWPTFNLADIFVVVGVIILLISSFQKSR